MPSTARRAQRRDRNEKELVWLARSLGAHWNYLAAGQGADGVITNRFGVMGYAEVKDPIKSPSERELTQVESDLRQDVEARGGNYWVIETDEDMIRVCGLKK